MLTVLCPSQSPSLLFSNLPYVLEADVSGRFDPTAFGFLWSLANALRVATGGGAIMRPCRFAAYDHVQMLCTCEKVVNILHKLYIIVNIVLHTYTYKCIIEA